MKTIKFNIPEGHIPLDIREFSVGEEYYIEVDLLAKAEQCTNHLIHDVNTCEKCSKKDDGTASL